MENEYVLRIVIIFILITDRRIITYPTYLIHYIYSIRSYMLSVCDMHGIAKPQGEHDQEQK